MNDEISFPEVKESPVYFGRLGRKLCPRNKAIINPETQEVYGVTTKKYKLIRHEEALETVNQVLSANPEFGKSEVNVRLLNDGGRMWTSYKFPETSYDIGGGDLVNPTIELMNSYDTAWPFSVRFGAFRLVCSNGLVVGKTFVWYKHRHTHDLELEKVSQILCKGMEAYSDQVELWKKWLDKVTTSTEYERIMEGAGFHQKEKEELHQEVERSSNLTLEDMKLKTLSYWIFYNLITQYITHKIKNQVRQANILNRIGNLF